MSISLYRKYRPTLFSDILGQVHIVRALSGAIRNNRIGHAYLFTGPRGTGKTTIARIYAKALNCSSRKNDLEPCGKCKSCQTITQGTSLNIIEIDAASHTGVENIRQLREEIRLSPTNAPYKIYIIDEVHMLSTGAFNALLKTLEEPPAHAIFILATTEIHKVPETIISRCQRFDFTRLSPALIIEKLKSIAKSEKVTLDPEAFEMIALSAEGGMRDAESLLSQVISLEDTHITADETRDILGIASQTLVLDFLRSLTEKDTASALKTLDTVTQEGLDLEHFAKSTLHLMRHMLLLSISPDMEKQLEHEATQEEIQSLKKILPRVDILWILKATHAIGNAQQRVRSSFIPQLPLEEAAVELTLSDTSNDASHDPPSTPANSNHNIPPSDPSPSESQSKETHLSDSSSETESPTVKTSSNTSATLNSMLDKWPQVVKESAQYNQTLSAFLSHCRLFSLEEKVLTVAAPYALYKEKLNEASNKLTIEKLLLTIGGAELRVQFITQQEAGITLTTEPTQPKPSNPSILADALDVFGGQLAEEQQTS